MSVSEPSCDMHEKLRTSRGRLILNNPVSCDMMRKRSRDSGGIIYFPRENKDEWTVQISGYQVKRAQTPQGGELVIVQQS